MLRELCLPKFLTHILLSIIFCFLPSLAWSQDSTSKQSKKENSWRFQHQDGWFFYKYKAPQQKNKKEIFPSQLPVLSSAWLKQALPVYLEHALDNPNPENVKAYLYLQQYSQEKAHTFSDLASIVSQGNNILDRNASNPLVASAQAYRKQVAYESQHHFLQRIAKEALLVFFHSNNFEVLSQAQLLLDLKKTYNFKIIALSIDGQPLNLDFDQQSFDRGLSKEFSIQAVPAIAYVRNNKHFVVSQGGVDLNSLKRRILQVAYQDQLITETELHLSQGRLFSTQLDFVKNLPANSNIENILDWFENN